MLDAEIELVQNEVVPCQLGRVCAHEWWKQNMTKMSKVGHLVMALAIELRRGGCMLKTLVGEVEVAEKMKKTDRIQPQAKSL